ncbi:MAG: acyl-CoA reductase [Bacteroidetes bacterium]|nr:acyl-CoA reductase [Bacteroidota bacterium]
MNLQKRIELLQKLKNYLEENGPQWQEVKARASLQNAWFTPEFIDLAIENSCRAFLTPSNLQQWVQHYHLDNNIVPKNIGVVMAGNIPLVGFHDFLCVFISGHKQTIKLSSKDEVMLKHIVQQLTTWDEDVQHYISFADMLKGCDAYIATGSNNSARYFEQYFSKYPSIIRRNRTSVAIITGQESADELGLLANDVHQFFGLGCRNVTKILVPEGYDFVPLLRAFDQYLYLADHHKYKNNYDYQLSLALMNHIFYMTNGSTLLVQSDEIFSAISQLHYSFYTDADAVVAAAKANSDIQCIVGRDHIPFGTTQQPGLFDYADGVDTMQFLLSL